jgi:flagellar motility protein MotE (MotC chaperone)
VKNKLLLILSGFVFLVAAASVVMAEEKHDASAVASAAEAAKAEPSEAPKAKPAAKKATPVALTMEAIQELEDRKNTLDSRERELTERAKNLDVQEKVLKEKLRRMEELNGKMAEKLDGFKKEHEDKIAKLVAVVEGMKPAAAAEYVENLEPELAVEILGRMQVVKASKLLNLVDKKKSARLTEMFTGYRDSLKDSSAAPINGPAPASVGPAKEASGKQK